MRLLIKLDEDLPPSLCALFNEERYLATTVFGQGWSGTADDVLLPRVVAEGACFVTADKGFGDLRQYALSKHHGIVILRPDCESRQHFARLLSNFLLRHDLRELGGCLTVVTDQSIRIRRPSAQ